ncbi:phosphoenolpyruvate carboxylase [Niveispirillum irakense]|uniref:phosphoenolpyruvate carboxylase n=1 Tax=Niveispirillum irakense TaxID=34011 RepID=UPI0003F9EA02|nr:phosphoenolpyruvate carboxylase [Niveispirillum irakense]
MPLDPSMPQAAVPSDLEVLATVTAKGPLLPTKQARYTPPKGLDAKALAGDLLAQLDRFSAETSHDPFANPVMLLALDISRRLAAGELAPGALEQLIHYLSSEGFLARAARLSRYLGEAAPEANASRLEELLDVAITGNGAEKLSFEAFQKLVQKEVFGIVITAHPTFNLPGALMEALACLATGYDKAGKALDEDARAALIRKVATSDHTPEDMSLAREHELSLDAIANIQTAIRTLYRAVLRVGRRHYPERWTELTPRLMTVASWVGYDLDGRSDIRWSDTLHKRLIVQQRQLNHYLMALRGLRAKAPALEDLRHTLALIESRLALALNQVTDEIAAFGGTEAQDIDHLRRIARRMHEGLPLRLVDAGEAIEFVDRAIRLAASVEGEGAIGVVEELAVLRAELSAFGLGMAHTHVRLNSTQVHNAIRKAVGLETAADDPRYRQSYLAALTDLLDKVEPVNINFGSIIAERTSAKRLFMVVAQMLKYSDARVPIRFLIAESESAFTVLSALYFAKLFGVDGQVDISPLFETEKALEVGSRIIEQLLENPHYRAYVQKRGRLCIQMGYSDAGRYLGQTPAAASIERLRLRILRLFNRHCLAGVQLVIFDTHGESIGRGGHPASLHNRLAYVSPPATLAFAAKHGIELKQEVSFQGGDGYLYFVTPASALAVVTRILEYMIGTAKPDLEHDVFYAEGDYIREFFTTVKTFQVGLVDDPDYGELLAAFGTNLLFPSGSRAIKRQHDSAPDAAAQVMAGQFRAIPHNAILLQLGLPANVLSGVGEAIDREPEHFRRLYATSPRFRELLGIVVFGLSVSCPDALKAYVDTLDPAHWLARAARSENPLEADDMRRIAAMLEATPTHQRLINIFRKLYRDYGVLQQNLNRAGAAPPPNPALERHLRLLHAVRLALTHQIYKLAVHVPEFSSQHSITNQRLVTRLLHLDVPWALEQLGRIFPARNETPVDEGFGEVATYVSDESQDYSQENQHIFRPIAQLYELIRRTGNAVSQRIGFFG